MKIGNYKDVKQESIEHILPGVKGAKLRWLIHEDVGKTFLLRRYDFDPNTTIPIHQHSHEHEIYVLEGKGSVFDINEEREVGPGDFVYIEPDIPHGFKSKAEPFVFLCIIPKERGDVSIYEPTNEK